MASCYRIDVECGPLDKDGRGANGGTTYLMGGTSKGNVYAAAYALEKGKTDGELTVRVTRYHGDTSCTVLDAAKLIRRLERCSRGKDSRLGILVDADVRTPGFVVSGRVALTRHKGPGVPFPSSPHLDAIVRAEEKGGAS